MLTRLNVKATFKFVGEKARVLEQRGRTDVIAALKPHDIGYHSNTHSQQPTIAVYLQHAGWDDGRAEFERREGQGARDVARIFGRTPVAYGQPGSAWAPQSYPALRAMGIGMYLDESDHVGIDDQPFYYGGMLNVFKMRSTLARMALDGTDLAASTGTLHDRRQRAACSGRRHDQHLLPPVGMGARRVLGRGELQPGRQPAARGLEAAADAAGRGDREGLRGLRAVHPVHPAAARRAGLSPRRT